MAWIANETPADTSFLVVTGGLWFVDSTSEWFPVLSERPSLATVQGYEWLGKAAFDEQLDRNFQLQLCVAGGIRCVDEWIERYEAQEAWLYVPILAGNSSSSTGDCCRGLREALLDSGRYEVELDGSGGVVLRPASPG
jgi:hypothetical protein